MSLNVTVAQVNLCCRPEAETEFGKPVLLGERGCHGVIRAYHILRESARADSQVRFHGLVRV